MEEKKTYKAELFEKVSALMMAAFGLVAALAWNDAIQTLFKQFFGPQSGLIAKFIYALAITALVVFVTIRISRIQHRIRIESEEDK